MAQPIAIRDERLNEYLRLFVPAFSLPQYQYFVTVLMGLIQCDERRTLSALLRHVAGDITLSGLSRFMAKSSWSVEEVTTIQQKRFEQRVAPLVTAAHAQQRAQRPRRVGRPKPTVVTGYLIIDDSTHQKRYAHVQEGLGRHYSGTEKKVVTGHNLFQSVYLLEGQQLPLRPRMYRQKADCVVKGVPFLSKVDMAYQTVTTFVPPPGTHTHLLVDTWYMAKRVWKAARQRGWDVTGGLKSNRVIRLVASDGTRQWRPVSSYAAGLRPDDFTPVSWPTQDGDKTVYAHLLKTWVRKLGPCQVLIVKPSPEAEPEQTRYWATSRLDDTLEQVVTHAAQRWPIEVLFADLKELMGSDHYQIRSAQGILRFWLLSLCLYQFLDEVRTAHRCIWGEHLTLGQARQQVRQSHADQLLDWIVDQVTNGATGDEIRNALQPAMQL